LIQKTIQQSEPVSLNEGILNEAFFNVSTLSKVFLVYFKNRKIWKTSISWQLGREREREGERERDGSKEQILIWTRESAMVCGIVSSLSK
jgi:hypothetical protein